MTTDGQRRAVCPGPSTRSPTVTSTSSRARRGSSTRSSSRSASTCPRTASSTPRSASTCSRTACEPLGNVRVEGFTGLLTDFCREHDVQAIVKGLRAVSDFDYELQMAQMNASLAPASRPSSCPTTPEYSFLASSPGQGGRDVRRRRVRPGARLRARAARRPAGRARDDRRTRVARGARRADFGVPRATRLRFTGSVVSGPGSDPLTSLDPRAPLVLDTRELGRRPGSQRQVSRTVPAPADLGIEVLGVPEGSPVELDLRLEAVMEGVLVTGTAHAALEGECARCLEPITDEVDVTFQELFVYDDHAPRLATTRTTRSAGSRTTCSTSSPCCGTRWCSHCRSSRCARTTVPGCAPSVAHGSRTTRTTRTRRRSTRGGPAWRRCQQRRQTRRQRGDRQWLSRSGRCRAATRVTVARSGRPSRRPW